MLDFISEMMIMVAHKTDQYENIKLDVISHGSQIDSETLSLSVICRHNMPLLPEQGLSSLFTLRPKKFNAGGSGF